MSNNRGYIRLSRKFFENPYWGQKRTFSLSEAWLDLIQRARFEDTPMKVYLNNGKEIVINRGEIHGSLRFFANHWGWGIEKAKRFIDRHIDAKEIERRVEQGESVLKLCNYEIYNPLPYTDQYTDQYSNQYTDQYSNQYTDRTATDTPTSTNTNKEKKEKKDKEEREGETPHLPSPAIAEEAPNPKKNNEKLPAKEIKELWNVTCTGFPKLHVLSENRKNKIRVRIEEMGGVEKALPLIKQIFEKAQASKFLKGDNKKGWKASFDWLFENDKNWVKVWEGNYDDNKGKTAINGSNLSVNDIWG